MKKITVLCVLVISICVLVMALPKIYALSSYSLVDVASHNASGDCWMVIDQQVYNLTEYLSDHDKELDIRSWCGTDATEAYATKNGMDRAHSDRADSLLSQYAIGTLADGQSTDSVLISQTSGRGVNTSVSGSPYNILIPLIGTVVVYVLSLMVLKRQTHNFIWNSIMLLGLIPSFFFGIGMILAKQVSWLSMFSASNILYSHVELSIIFGVSCLLHLILRLRIYFAQAKTLHNKTDN